MIFCHFKFNILKLIINAVNTLCKWAYEHRGGSLYVYYILLCIYGYMYIIYVYIYICI